jgi:WYL domain
MTQLFNDSSRFIIKLCVRELLLSSIMTAKIEIIKISIDKVYGHFTMTRKGSAITLSLQDRDKDALKQIAHDLGITWGDKPNISKLIEAIARRKFIVTPNNNWPPARIQTLINAQKLLIDAGHQHDATILTELLLSRSELTLPQRSDLQQFLDNPLPTWRQTLDQYIRSQTPFRLAYYDAADRPFSFSIHHAQIMPIEKRQYLQCWCAETEQSRDIPELAHNRSLRLDRIPESAITPLKAKWRSNLDTVEVEFHLFHNLAFAYNARSNDIVSELVGNPPIRRVVRQVASSFWFFREIFPYGEDCELIHPENLRLEFSKKVQALAASYQNH